MYFYELYTTHIFFLRYSRSNITKSVKIELRTKSCDILKFFDIFLTETRRIS